MNETCTVCNGKMAHYYTYPDNYCIKHSNWTDKCISQSKACITRSDIKVAMVIPDDGYFICPTDGMIKDLQFEASPTIIPSSLLHSKHWAEGEAPADLKEVTKHAVGLMESGGVSSQTQENLPSVPGKPAYDFFKGHMMMKKKTEAIQTVERATAAVDAEKLIPVLHDSYEIDVNNFKADEELKERAKKELTTEKNLVAVDKAREHVKTLEGTPAMQYLEGIPEHRRFEVVKGLSTSPVNSMNETYHALRENVGLEGNGLEVAASIQKEAMWYLLKPRWILRRKAQAAIRNKVRSVIKPVSLKI